MITISGLSYSHANGDPLLNQLNLVIQANQKTALVGNNGSGKSTLLNILARETAVTIGDIQVAGTPYYVRQHFGHLDNQTVAEVLGVSEKLAALDAIEFGDVSESNLALVADDWSLHEQCNEAFKRWGVENISLKQKFGSLSGGQKTKVLLSGVFVTNRELILMDEPTNHLDGPGRQMLYDFVNSTRKTLLVVSHDRMLLNLFDQTLELVNGTIKVYGGNYDFYSEQKTNALVQLRNQYQTAQKEMKKIRSVEKQTLERKQKQDARGKKKQEKAGLPRIMQNTLKSNAERSTAKLKIVHEEKITAITDSITRLRDTLPATSEMKLSFDNSLLHYGKKLFEADNINVVCYDRPLWKTPLSFSIYSGERINITGRNGSGKTTLMKLFLGELMHTGLLYSSPAQIRYIDQDYRLINNSMTVLEQAQYFNKTMLPEHEIKIRLHRFLFDRNTWDRTCSSLSGGEKMRLMLCCLAIGDRAPDVIILDEPTNNLDLANVTILTEAIKNYKGTLIIISHDSQFITEVGINRQIEIGDKT